MQVLLSLHQMHIFIKYYEKSNSADIQPIVKNTSKQYLFLINADTSHLYFSPLHLGNLLSAISLAILEIQTYVSGLLTWCSGSQNLMLTQKCEKLSTRRQGIASRYPFCHTDEHQKWVSHTLWPQPSTVSTCTVYMG